MHPCLDMQKSTDPVQKQISPANRSACEWHSEPIELALSNLQASRSGLNSDQAQERRVLYGANVYEQQKSSGFLKRLVAQIHNLLIYVLIAAALITWLIDHRLDSIVILTVVVLNISIGLYQEGKAEKSLQAIEKLLAPQAQVLRDGKLQTLAAEDIVPGDVVTVASGDNLPADLRWIGVVNLRVDESALTGESVAVSKSSEPVALDATIGDRSSMGYAGTIVTQGQGHGLVVATGMQTEMGRIGRLMQTVQSLETPLVRNMTQFSRWLTFTILTLALLLLAYGIWIIGLNLPDTFMAVVGLAVAAIPEGLPAILTITLSIGVQRMARRNAVVRRLPAVETLGAVTVICSDKTGTLTRNEMTAQSVVLENQELAITGSGYGPDGAVTNESEPEAGFYGMSLDTDTISPVTWVALTSALCNDASLSEDINGDWSVSGDPTEGALLTLSMKLGSHLRELHQKFPRTCTVPFESEHRFMATGHDNLANPAFSQRFILVKGAPEKILSFSSDELASDGSRRAVNLEYWTEKINRESRLGRRVLGIAIKTDVTNLNQHNIQEHVHELTFVGIVGIIDPPREEAILSVALCKQAQINVKMITGDHAGTALAIAKELGIGDGKHVITGHEIQTLSDDQLQTLVEHTDVFARASPEHKIRIVRALQANDHIVAMTGDGVNDSPALKQADIGIAMGKKGTEAAKQASEIVLGDDNFASIANAVEEGRTVYDNLKKTIAFLLPINGGESMAIGAAILLGTSLPITPLQILWVNMVSSIGLAMILAFESAEPDVMSRAPRPRHEPLLSKFLIWRILFVASLFLSGIFSVFHWSLSQGESIEVARTMAVNTLVSMEIFYLFSVRYLKSRSFTWQGVKGTPLVLASVTFVAGVQILMTYWPTLQNVFETKALSLTQLTVVIGIGALVLLVLEVEKLLLRRSQQATL
ncbi:MAG: HAD-IC family P-type ATPase [Burkholderiaceae bacterium]|nr:HAD-IC family P-type ATPase [Burkholderiaceae bacterium]